MREKNVPHIYLCFTQLLQQHLHTPDMIFIYMAYKNRVDFLMIRGLH